MNALKRLFLTIFVLGFTVFSPFSVYAASVKAVTFGADKTGQLMTINLTIDGHVPYRAFTLADPERVVLDFPALQWTAPAVQRDASGIVKSYRHGLYQNKGLRIVFEVTQKVTISRTETVATTPNKPLHYIIYLRPSQKVTLNPSRNTDEPASSVQATLTLNEKTTVKTVEKTRLKNEESLVKSIKTVVIDAGHGGVDPGAIATNGVYEKNITLGVARELKDMLQASGRYNVKMTRDSDVFVILQDRVKIARRARGDLFVSLHADTISRPAVQGASVYSLSDKASDAEAARLAERENQVDALVGGVNLGTQDKDVADILLDLVVRDNMNQSKILADTVVQGLRRGGVQTLDGSHRFAGFAVLKAPDIPSILVEMGYLSNPSEAERLNTVEHRQRIARAVMNAIDIYFNETSKKTEF